MKGKVRMRNYGRRNKNKGFSIVELLIAAAILAIVSVSIALAMTTSSRTYSTSSVEAQLQSEAQLVANAISELAIDAQNATDQPTPEWLATLSPADQAKFDANLQLDYLVDATKIADNAQKILILDAVEDSKKVQYIVAKSDKNAASPQNKIYLSKREWNTPADPSTPGSWDALDDFSLLGNYIGDFTVDTTKVEKDNLLVFKLKYDKNSRSYDGNYQVLMRNKAYASEDEEDEADTAPPKITASIMPEFIYPAVRGGLIQDYYEGAVVDDARYHRYGTSIEFTGGYRTKLADDKLKSTWEIMDNAASDKMGTNDGLFTLGTANTSALNKMNTLNIQADANGYKDLGYDSFRIKFFLTGELKDGSTIVSNEAVANVRMLRIKSLTLKATSGFSAQWKDGWGAQPADEPSNVDGYAYPDSSGNLVDMGLNAAIDCTDWVPYRGGVSWKLEKADGSGAWVPCNNAGFAKLAITESKNSTMNTLQFGKSAMAGQYYRITATSMFDPDYEDSMIIGIGKISGGNGDGFYSRGYYIDLTSWFEQEKGVTTPISKIEIGSQGNSWESAHVEYKYENGRIYLYVSYDSSAYTQQQRRSFYDGSGEVKYRIYDKDGNQLRAANGEDLIAYNMGKVTVTKVTPTNKILVVTKGGSKNVRVKTNYYNLISKDYFGIFIDDTETNLNRAGMTDYHKDLKVETASAYGDVYNYVDEMLVTVTPKTSTKDYNPYPMRLRLAALDYYNLTRVNNSDGTTSYDAVTYQDYTVYVANVKGSDVFIPGPGTTGTSAKIDGTELVWPDSVGSSKVSINGYDSSGNLVTNIGKVYVEGNKTKLDYNGSTYTYSNTYHYWNK